ncbi:MAG: hypothetical protein EOO14_07395 [Chitinophagaceae bacterium]|nr:MAG: hypothetical protein EOO14_07395 [Chitinophagaceae bacterium]
MKKLLIALSVLVSLSACQKEGSFEIDGDNPGNPGNPGNGGNPNGSLLVRVGARIGADTITTNFSYNSANLLTAYSYSGSVLGESANAEIRVVRNAANIISALVVKADIYDVIGLDSVVTNFVYDAVKRQYKHGVGTYTFMGVPTTDSAVFSYNAAGNVQSVTSFHDEGNGFELDTKVEYTYSGNNLASVKNYSFDGSVFELEQTTTYDQYDDKINPLEFKADAPALGMTSHFSANNVVKQTVTDHFGGASQTASYTFSYNTVNRPTRSVSTNGMASAVTSYVYM